MAALAADPGIEQVDSGASGMALPTGGIFQRVLPLLTFSIPTLCISITNPLLSLVDTAVVGLGSEAQLAAMAPATMLSDSLCYLLTFVAIATTNLVSLSMARGLHKQAGAPPTLPHAQGPRFMQPRYTASRHGSHRRTHGSSPPPGAGK